MQINRFMPIFTINKLPKNYSFGIFSYLQIQVVESIEIYRPKKKKKTKIIKSTLNHTKARLTFKKATIIKVGINKWV